MDSWVRLAARAALWPPIHMLALAGATALVVFAAVALLVDSAVAQEGRDPDGDERLEASFDDSRDLERTRTGDPGLDGMAARAKSKSWRIRTTFPTKRFGRINLMYGNQRFGYRHIKQRRGWSDKGMNRFIRRVFRTGERFCQDPPKCTTLTFSVVRNVTRQSATEDRVVVSTRIHPRTPRRVGIITAYSRRIYFPQSGGGGCRRICYP